MSEKDLHLNSISRYSKQSPRLILEEHGHCEVPAGCGGVVLRWRKAEQVPFTMWLYTTCDKVDIYLDSNTVNSARPLLDQGKHIIALRISKFNPHHGLLMFAGLCEYMENQTSILSLPDRSWKYSLIEPGNNSWLNLEFDDSTWLSMIPQQIPQINRENRGFYQLRKLQELGAESLGIEGISETACIRKVFTL